MSWGTTTVLLCALQLSTTDWVSEWMTPLQGQLFEETPDSYRRSGTGGMLKQYEDEYERMVPILNSKETPVELHYSYKNKPLSAGGLKVKLETTLENAKALAEALAKEIAEVTKKEQELKEAIARGRNGVTTVTVSTIGQLPRKYIIRDGSWTLCTGVVTPGDANAYSELGTQAKCFGQEVTTKPDPCVFHSVIKYETIPTRRRLQYVEDDYLCLKPTFNNTMEYYMSVPRRLINETCTNGMVRSLEDNMIECGMRVLSEYNYYPNRGYPTPDLSLPLEYCAETDGACKLIVAWHVSNATIENFEFLKNEPSFKKYFMNIKPY